VLFTFAHEAAGASDTRLSLRPLVDGAMITQSSGEVRREDADSCHYEQGGKKAESWLLGSVIPGRCVSIEPGIS
jgi:hypothetical protein